MLKNTEDLIQRGCIVGFLSGSRQHCPYLSLGRGTKFVHYLFGEISESWKSGRQRYPSTTKENYVSVVSNSQEALLEYLGRRQKIAWEASTTGLDYNCRILSNSVQLFNEQDLPTVFHPPKQKRPGLQPGHSNSHANSVSRANLHPAFCSGRRRLLLDLAPGLQRPGHFEALAILCSRWPVS